MFFSCKNNNTYDFSGNVEILLDSTITSLNLQTQKDIIIHAKKTDMSISSVDRCSINEIRAVAKDGFVDNDSLLFIKKDSSAQIVVTRRYINFPRFSPNGEFIAYVSRTEKFANNKYIGDLYIHLVDVDNKIDKRVFDKPVGVYKPDWLRDQNSLVVSSKDLSLYIVDLDTGKYRKIVEHGFAPTVSHNGKYIAYLSTEITPNLKNELIEYINMSQDDYIKKSNVPDSKKKLNELWYLFHKNSIYIYDIEKGDSRRITLDLCLESNVLWSPNDRYIMYNEEAMLNHDIYVVNIKNGDTQKIEKINGKIVSWYR